VELAPLQNERRDVKSAALGKEEIVVCPYAIWDK
jgi:hypothetical protein